jgi:hypothetical protein
MSYEQLEKTLDEAAQRVQATSEDEQLQSRRHGGAIRVALQAKRLLDDVERFGPEGRPRQTGAKYTIPESWALICKMLDACVDLRLPPPPELGQAVYLLAGRPPAPRNFREKVDGVSRGMVGRWYRAVAFEAGHPPASEGDAPSEASVSAVSRHAGVTRDTILRWRRKMAYRVLVACTRNRRTA